MRINPASTDSEVLLETGKRLKKIRIEADMTQKDVVEATGMSLRTLRNIESGKDAAFSSIIRVMRALRVLDSLDNAVPEPGMNPGEIFRLGKERERVRRRRDSHGTWKWGDEA